MPINDDLLVYSYWLSIAKERNTFKNASIKQIIRWKDWGVIYSKSVKQVLGILICFLKMWVNHPCFGNSVGLYARITYTSVNNQSRHIIMD